MHAGGNQIALRRAISMACGLDCSLVASRVLARYSSSYMQKDSKKRFHNPLLPPRYKDPSKNKPPPAMPHSTAPPKQPLLEQQDKSLQEDDVNFTLSQENTPTQTNNTTQQLQQQKTKQEDLSLQTHITQEHLIDEVPPDIQDVVSFEDKDDLEPSICQYMFSLDIQYLRKLDFGDKTYLDKLDTSKQPKNARVVAFTAPTDDNVNRGGKIFPPSIVGYIKDYDETNTNPNAGILMSGNFIPNPLFCDFLLKAISKHVAHDPDTCEYARTATNSMIRGAGGEGEFIPVWDYRSPLVDGLVERENIIGAAKVMKGKIVEGDLVANEGYRLLDDTYGWCSVSKFMFQNIYQDLIDFADKSSAKKK